MVGVGGMLTTTTNAMVELTNRVTTTDNY